jgi:hypothetical protein
MISYFNIQKAHRVRCLFKKNFLSESTCHQIRLLPVFTQNGNHMYVLTEKQNRQVAAIIGKIVTEKEASGLFSPHLQRVHVIELIHFVMKVHQKAFSTC